MDPLTRFGALGGGLLTVVGVLGFAVTGVADPFAVRGQHLLVLVITPAQNLLHLVMGLAMVIGTARNAQAARTTTLVASAALGMLGLVGLIPAGPGTPLALDTWGSLLHLVLAAWGAGAIIRSRNETPRMEVHQS